MERKRIGLIAPVLDELAAESNGRYPITKLNVDENPRTAAQFQIRSIPTLLIFKNGKLVDQVIVAQPKQTIARATSRAFLIPTPGRMPAIPALHL